jgi:hypothetical protein
MYWWMGLRARDQRNERGGGSAHAGCTQGELLPLHDAIGFRLVYCTIRSVYLMLLASCRSDRACV